MIGATSFTTMVMGGGGAATGVGSRDGVRCGRGNSGRRSTDGPVGRGQRKTGRKRRRNGPGRDRSTGGGWRSRRHGRTFGQGERAWAVSDRRGRNVVHDDGDRCRITARRVGGGDGVNRRRRDGRRRPADGTRCGTDGKPGRERGGNGIRVDGSCSV